MPSRRFFHPAPIDLIWPPRWSFCAAVARSPIPRIAALVPLIGYAVLWGDQLHSLLMRFGVLGPPLLFSPLERLNLLYIGGLLVLGGMVCYWVFCPRQLRHFSSAHEYGRSVVDTADYAEVRKGHTALSRLLEDVPSQDEQPEGPLFGAFSTRLVMNGHAAMGGSTLVHMFRGDSVSSINIALAAYYETLNRRLPVLAGLSITLLVLGAILFLAPSAEVALLVIRHILGWA